MSLSIKVVDRNAARFGVANEDPISVEADDISICKTPSHDTCEFGVLAPVIISVVDKLTEAASDQPNAARKARIRV